MDMRYSWKVVVIVLLVVMICAYLVPLRKSYPVLGKDPIPSPLVVEDHSDVLAIWAERGIRDAVLVNLDTHDDFRWIPDAKVQELLEIYRQKDWRRFREVNTLADRGLYHVGNWIYAGARLGIIREVYWVVPSDIFSRKAPSGAMHDFLRAAKFSDEDIATFSYRDNQFHGSFRGMPVTICGLESLPSIDEPVLLSIDDDFFPVYSKAYRSAYLPALHEAFSGLYRKNYRIRDAALSYSVNGDFFPPHLRWVGDAVVEIFRRPGMIYEAPSELLALQQQADNAYRSVNASEILAALQPYLDRRMDGALLAYAGYAFMLQGNVGKALAAEIAACNHDRRYCSCLPYTGTLYALKGRYRDAERFFRAELAADPEMSIGLFQYAYCLKKMGRLKESMEYLLRDETASGSFPTRFLIAENAFMRGDAKTAVGVLKTEIRERANDIYATVISRVAADAIYDDIDFCDKNGFGDVAEALRRLPAIAEMIRNFPR